MRTILLFVPDNYNYNGTFNTGREGPYQCQLNKRNHNNGNYRCGALMEKLQFERYNKNLIDSRFYLIVEVIAYFLESPLQVRYSIVSL